MIKCYVKSEELSKGTAQITKNGLKKTREEKNRRNVHGGRRQRGWILATLLEEVRL